MFEENIGIFLSFFQDVKILLFFVRFCRISRKAFLQTTKKRIPKPESVSGDPCENRTRDTAVKGRCLNRLTNGPHIYEKLQEQISDKW